ncbi:response regulator transcription factor [Pontibacter fetidus]|uniref:Response regulator n=1 Tax=Pontibacter fetidus TaxID=2700082 RepID=A0A6B2H952_9BACT|nr:response regulator [Pontibacter fetidus]NDK57686.1 response regulator [Pontibacter fetidus]
MNLKVLTVEDQDPIRKQILMYFNEMEIGDHTISMEEAEDFDIGIEKIKNNDYDIVILDLCKGVPATENQERPGYDVLQTIQSHSFTPVVFYTGLAHTIKELSSDIVGVVNKNDGLETLESEITRIIHSNLGLIKKQVYEHIRVTFRDFFWEAVHEESEVFGKVKNDVSIGYLLLRRIANSLSKEEIKKLLKDDKIKTDKAHPMEFYLYPIKREAEFELGDIIKVDDKFYITLTPTCDYVQRANGTRKATNVLLASLENLENFSQHTAYISNKSNGNKKSLEKILSNNESDRYFFLPGTPFLESKVVDFQNKTMISYESLSQSKRIARLDTPFAQAMLASFIRYYNRIGFPDLDTEYIIANV